MSGPLPTQPASAEPTEPASVDFEFAALEEARNYRARLMDEFKPYLKGAVAEIGAGIGQITAQLAGLPEVTRLVAVEPNPSYAARLRPRVPRAEVVEGTSSSLPADAAFDALLCVNVLEHIRDHAAELAQHRRLLAARRGHLCLFVPARQEIYSKIDRDFGHWRRYARRQLRAELETAGFEVVRLRYYNLAGYFGWWWHFKVNGGTRFGARSVRLFDRAIFPWVNSFERRVLPPPFGQSLLAVARPR